MGGGDKELGWSLVGVWDVNFIQLDWRVRDMGYGNRRFT